MYLYFVLTAEINLKPDCLMKEGLKETQNKILKEVFCCRLVISIHFRFLFHIKFHILMRNY